MADTKKEKPILVETTGVNEIEIGSDIKLLMLKVGESRNLKIKDKHLYKEKEVRWVVIATEYLEEARKMLPSQRYGKWGEWNTQNADEPVKHFGIGKQYVYGNSIKTRSRNEKDFTEGRIFYYEPFIDVPTLNKGYYIATIDTPKILSAYFAQYKDEFKYPGEKGTSTIYTYKKSIKLYILGHMLPNYTVSYHNFALFEVAIWDTDGNEITEKDKPLRFFQKTNPGTFSVNTITELNIKIDEKWRDKGKHKKGSVKTYYAKIKTIIYGNEDTFTGDEIGDIKEKHIITANANPRNNHEYLKFTNKFKSVAPNNETVGVIYTKEDELVSKSFLGRDTNKGKRHAAGYTKKDIGEYNTTEGTVLEGQQVSFQVRYDTMDVILDEYEAQKNNMFVVVGDVEYSAKNNEPCKYSKLQIEHKSRTEPFVLFDEDKTTKKPIDHTHLAFGIVAGDKKETIKITAEGLAIQSYHPNQKNKPKCLGITTAMRLKKGRLINKKQKHRNQEEFKHNTIKDVFTMDKAYVLYPEARTVTTNPNPETTGSETLDIRSQDIEYNYTKNGIELKVEYLYNKTYDTRAEEWLGNTAGEWTNDLLDIAWVVRYFALWSNQSQTYFVPIGTCRYPNQTAVIKMYPNIEWFINFKFNTDSPVYIKQYDNYKSRAYESRKAKSEKSDKYQKKRESSKKASAYTLDLAFGYKLNGKTYDLNLGNKHPVFNTINFALQAYETLDKLLMSSESKEKLPLAKASKMSKRAMRNLPLCIEVKRPSFSGGIHCKYLPSATNPNAIGWYLKLAFNANPLLAAEGRLDLLFFAQFIPVAGQFITALNRVLDGINLLTFGAVNIEYHIDLVVSSAVNVDIKPVSYHSIDGWQGPAIGFETTFEIGIEAGGSVVIDMFDIEGKGKIHGQGKAKFKAYASYNDIERSCPAQFTFEGLDALVYIRFSVERGKEGKKNKKQEQEETPHKIPLLGKIKGPKFELFKT